MTPNLKPSEKDYLSPLGEILAKIKQLSQDKKKSLVVFDLDSTLFDVSPRLQNIILNFCANPQNQTQFPTEIAFLKKIKFERSDWGIMDAMARVGLDPLGEEFHAVIRKFWLDCFFSNTYLKYDRPFEGAPEFCCSVAEAGGDIVYLSGRDRPRMEAGTIEVLQKWGFPLDRPDHQLALKPHAAMDDGAFKSQWFSLIDNQSYQKIWFFENEPVNINLVRKNYPFAETIFFDSTHAGIEHPPKDILKILHFLIDTPSAETSR